VSVPGVDASIGGAALVNLTPHDVDVVVGDGAVVAIPPHHPPARVAHEVVAASTCSVGGRPVPVVQLGAGAVADLPEPREGAVFIVSRSVALACPARSDLVFPFDLVRNERGAVVGCRGFARLDGPVSGGTTAG